MPAARDSLATGGEEAAFEAAVAWPTAGARFSPPSPTAAGNAAAATDAPGAEAPATVAEVWATGAPETTSPGPTAAGHDAREAAVRRRSNNMCGSRGQRS